MNLIWTATADAMPEPGVTVLAYYRNSHGKQRRIRAAWLPEKFEEISAIDDPEFADYDEEKDIYYYPQGWYEQIDNWGDFDAVKVNEGTVTHWMPLPACPE